MGKVGFRVVAVVVFLPANAAQKTRTSALLCDNVMVPRYS